MGVLLGSSESLSFRNPSAIVGKAPTGIGAVCFCQGASRNGTKFLSGERT